MKKIRTPESRSLIKTEAAVETLEGKKYISGIIPYNSRSQYMSLGYSYCNYEMLAPTVFNKTLADHSDIYVNYAHNDEHILARLSAGTLEVSNSPEGLTFRMLVPETPWGAEAYGTIASGNCRTISFEFIPYTWTEDEEANTATLTSAKLTAISLCVVNPAYTETDTFTSIRSVANKLKMEKDKLKTDEIKELRELVEELRSLIPEEETKEAAEEEKAEETAKSEEADEDKNLVEEPEAKEEQADSEQPKLDTQEEPAIPEVDSEYSAKVEKLNSLVNELEEIVIGEENK